MISLTFGLAGLGTEGGGSYMRLIYAPFDLMPKWSGVIPITTSGGHSHGYIEAAREPNYEKIFRFMTEIEGKTYQKVFKIKYPIVKLELINIEMREVKVNLDEK